MRSILGLALALGLPAVLSAQSAPNLFEIYPDAAGAGTSFTSRFNVGTGAGEVLLQVPSLFHGVGDAAGSCQIVSATYTTQDQDASTQESYSVVLRTPSSTVGPDPSAAGLIVSAGPFMTPLSTGIVAWVITATFAAPVTVPCSGGFYGGLSLSPNAGWSATDGQSIHCASYLAAYPTGDNPVSTAPNVAWQIISGVASQAASGRTVRFGVNTDAAVLNIANIDPTSLRSPGGVSYGVGGLYPAIKMAPRDDGLQARVRDHANDNGNAYLFLSLGAVNTGIPLPGFSGEIYLDPAMPPIILLGSGAISLGETLIPIAAPGTIPAAAGFKLQFQAVTVGPNLGNPRFSNAQGVSL